MPDEPDCSWVNRPSSFDKRHQPQARSEAIVRGGLVKWFSHLKSCDSGHFASAPILNFFIHQMNRGCYKDSVSLWKRKKDIINYKVLCLPEGLMGSKLGRLRDHDRYQTRQFPPFISQDSLSHPFPLSSLSTSPSCPISIQFQPYGSMVRKLDIWETFLNWHILGLHPRLGESESPGMSSKNL